MHRAVPVDVLQCQECSTTIAEEDWMAPVIPVIPGRCMNCGDRRERGVCQNCGLSQREDLEVHDELRQVVSPNATLLAAAREASRQGRRLIALKLATAAAMTNEDGQGETARALRIWLLAAIGETVAALEDAKAWVEHSKDATALAWACLGQQYQHSGFPGSAAEAYGRSLQKDGRQHNIRARRANIMMGMRREGQACDEAAMVLGAEGPDDQAIQLALEVLDQLADRYEQQLRDDEVERMLTLAGPHADRSAKLVAQRARLAALNGDVNAAKRDLKLAKKLDPNLNELYDRIERVIKPQKTSWWRW